eukprot:TRINITY_DN29033_c0_g1_i1.p1 TRINITY_DN29033_c0_g1~~TRINITY_DN29033_c0_g1_i1.p1  ORF type:complete len:593 (+),score=207.20 TRINITY_DN29033_c0_g1_i1:42-1820(+)
MGRGVAPARAMQRRTPPRQVSARASAAVCGTALLAFGLWLALWGFAVLRPPSVPPDEAPAVRLLAADTPVPAARADPPPPTPSPRRAAPPTPRPPPPRPRAAGDAVHVPRLHCGGGQRGPSGLGNRRYCAAVNNSIWRELETGDGSRLRASPALRALLQKQFEMHRLVQEGKEPAGQRYLVWSLSGGAGNRMQAMVSTFVAALLSGRVLLLKDWFTRTRKKGTPAPRRQSRRRPELLLENLPRPADAPDFRNDDLFCPALPLADLRDYRQVYPKYFGPQWEDHHVKVDVISKHDKLLMHWRLLGCTDLQAFPDGDTKFVYVWSNQYYLPLFYANPALRRRMRELFPDDDPFGPLSRFLLRPNADVERAVEDYYCEHFVGESAAGAGASVSDGPLFVPPQPPPRPVVGLQIRAFRPHGMSDMAHEFDGCLRSKLAELIGSGASIFLASMHTPVHQYFVDKYRTEAEGGKLLTRPAAIGEQRTGSVADERSAIADMLLLARTSDYILSPGSTFGSFVAGFHSQRPVCMHSMGLRKCSRLASSQPCFISWLRGDKIHFKMESGHFPCQPESVPDALTHACHPDLSNPFVQKHQRR